MARSVVDQMPAELREWLEGELVRRNFSGYRALVDAMNEMLEEKGLELSVTRSSIHRFGQQFEERIGAMKRTREMARTIAREVGDDEGETNDALIRMTQNKLFDLVLTTEIDPSKMSRVARAIADLGRAGIAQKKHQIAVRDKAMTVATAVADKAKAGGLSEESVDLIRREILGIADA